MPKTKLRQDYVRKWRFINSAARRSFIFIYKQQRPCV